MHKKAKKTGVDLIKYNQLKSEIHKIEYKLKKLRNPLKLHLNKSSPVASAESEDAQATPETASATSEAKPKDTTSAKQWLHLNLRDIFYNYLFILVSMKHGAFSSRQRTIC